MSQKLRDSIYGIAVAIAALLVALGIIDAATEQEWLGVVTAILAAVSAVAPVVAHLHLGSKGVSSTPASLTSTGAEGVKGADAVIEAPDDTIAPVEGTGPLQA